MIIPIIWDLKLSTKKHYWWYICKLTTTSTYIGILTVGHSEHFIAQIVDGLGVMTLLISTHQGCDIPL